MNYEPIGSGRSCVRSNERIPTEQSVFVSRGRFGALRRNLAAVLMLIVSAPVIALAQGNTAPARVTDRVDVTRLTTLKGNTHPLAQAKYDRGAAPADLPMNRMMLLLKRSPDQETALQNLLIQQQTTATATFHKWLTPDQFGQQYGLSDADIQAVTSWLASFGFQSIKVAKGRNVIEFSGTAAQVEAGLHTSIHQYFVNGENHWANSSDPQVPAALAPVISGIVSMHNFRPKSTIVRLDRKVTANITSGPQPQINLTNSQNQTIHAMVPADFNKIYNVGAAMTGSGVTIGIIANTNINVQDVAEFRSLWGLPVNTPNIVLNGPDPGDIPGSGDEGEAVLDATWSGAVAPAATVDLVVSEDTNAAQGTDLSEFYIVDNNLADVMTESFEACESQFGSSLFGANGAAAFYSGMAEQAAAQGITYLVSSGDGGPDACDDPSTEPGTTTSVNLLASTPFDVAVGGTEFHDCDPVIACTDTAGTYWLSSNGTNGESAKGYIPEEVWNESCTVAQAGQPGCPASGLWSSGGGASIAFLTAPPWQAGVTGLPGTHPRLVPDVALTAADHDGYVLCIDGTCPQQLAIASGTSASVQAFGGIMALVDQKMGGRVGIANDALYKLAAQQPPTSPANSTCNGSSTTVLPANTCIFNDVTTGNTNVPGLTGFTAAAAPGYDETTGLGSVNVSNLVNNWHTAIIDASTTTLRLNNGTAVSVMHGTAIPVESIVAPVAPATGTPTGDISLIANSSTDQGVDFFTLSSGSVNALANSTILLPGGTGYQVHAHYEGDGTFLGGDSAPVTVTVTPEPSEINFGIVVNSGASGCLANSNTVAYGSAYVLTVDVSDLNTISTPCSPSETGSSPTGTVTLTDAFNGGSALPLDGGTFNLNSFGYFEDQTIQLPAGTHSITANYSGDPSFDASGPVSGVVTVLKATTTTAVAANPTATQSAQTVLLTATVSTQSNAIANASQEPTGTIQFLLNGAALGGAVTVTGGVNTNTQSAQAVATLSTTTLPTGSDVITAQYSGDGNYSPSSTTASVTVTIGTAGINLASGCSSTITISTPGQSGSCLITASGANGFSGTITLSATLSGSPSGAVDAPMCAFGAPDLQFTAPNTITLSSGNETGNATMTCSSTAASRIPVQPSHRPSSPGWPLAGAAICAAGLLFLLAGQRQQRWRFIPLAVLLVVIATAVVSCGGGSTSGGGGGNTNPGTTTGAYSFTVKATPSTGTAQTTTVTVNVQ